MLDGFNLPNSKLDRLAAEIVDTDHEHRPAVRLKLSGRRPNEDQRILLARDESRLPIPHESLLLRIGSLERDRFASRRAAGQRGASGRQN
uniref:Uncharacterized protein n=1 Tax=Bradyrhizobium amphicarpaeae TaxID=1404768 RepID=A0A2U8PP41_9BRAD|nr:hypothetical protein CIT40_05760 [Bradyrhizobium amphicarpaeae]